MIENPLIISTETIDKMVELIRVCGEQGYPVSHFSITQNEMQMFLKPIPVGGMSTHEEAGE